MRGAGRWRVQRKKGSKKERKEEREKGMRKILEDEKKEGGKEERKEEREETKEDKQILQRKLKHYNNSCKETVKIYQSATFLSISNRCFSPISF